MRSGATAARSTDAVGTAVLDVTLLTRVAANQLSGGHLYHRRLVDAAATHGARIEVRSSRAWRDPFAGAGDVVLVDSLVAAAVAPWLALGRRPRGLAAIVHQQPGGVDQPPLRRAVQRRLDAFVYRRCDVVIAASDHVAAQLEAACGVPSERICVARPGRDLPGPAAPVAADLRNGRRLAVLCVANWLPNKGIAEVLDAVALLPPAAVTLHLVGCTDADEVYAERVLDRLTADDLADRVVVHGPLDPHELPALYAGADAFVLASRSEAYGTVYAEALSAGLPIVGWRSGNLPNLIDDGVHGCLVDRGDVAALGAALGRLADEPAWRDTLASAARARGTELPTWDDTAARVFGALSRWASPVR